MKKNKKEIPVNAESVDQWLARGGQIKKVDFTEAYKKFKNFGGKYKEYKKTLTDGTPAVVLKKAIAV